MGTNIKSLKYGNVLLEIAVKNAKEEVVKINVSQNLPSLSNLVRYSI